MICPNCKSDRAHRSHRNGVSDWFAAIKGETPYRCHACNRRFRVTSGGTESKEMRTKTEREILRTRREIRWRRNRLTVAMYGIGLAIFGLLLALLLQDRTPAGSP